MSEVYEAHNRAFWGRSVSGNDLVRLAHLRSQIKRYEGMLALMVAHDAPESAVEAMCAKITDLRKQLGA